MNRHRHLIACAAVLAMLSTPDLFGQACGTTVYDTGGAGGDYANNQAYTVTYCPTNPGDVVTITFTAFNTEAGWDELSVHNGPSNASTELGLFSGTTLPGSFTSTDPTGCLTLWFTSDFSNVASGWVANITCSTPPPPPPSCGTTVYDTGGSGGNYGNSQTYSTTYCPTTPGDVVTLNFTAFNTEAGFDYVTIHNGPTAGSPVVGSFSGTCNPGSFTSSDPSGCITLEFDSDFITTAAGWTATISCAPPAPPPVGGCFLVLRLFDSNGNGWGASFVGVSINGGPPQNYTVACSFNQVLIPVSTGDIVALSYSNGGPGQGQNSYILGLQGSANPLFVSGSPPTAGNPVFLYTATCQPPPSPPEDCFGSITICNNQSFNNTTNNTGNVADLTLTSAGCLGALERQGTWYNFTPSAGGTVGFTINPTNPLDDYDFAIWGPFPPGSTPNSICPPLGAPLRCSFAAPSGATGLNSTATDVSEDPLGDKWVQNLTVTTGQVYLLYISNYSQSGLAFSLGWDLGGGASLDCTILGADILNLDAEANNASVEVSWTAVHEASTSYYLIERSADGVSYSTLGRSDAVGDPDIPVDYRFVDQFPGPGMNYYRLEEVDHNGHATTTPPVPVLFGNVISPAFLAPNPLAENTVLFLNWADDGPCTLAITDASGREVVRSSMALVAGQHRIPLELPQLEHGAYVLKLFAADGCPRAQIRFVSLR